MTADTHRVSVSDLVGEHAITRDQGQQVYDAIHDRLLAGETVVLDVAGVRTFAAPFLGAAVGQLCSYLIDDQIKNQVRFLNLPRGMRCTVRVVLETSRQYYANPSLFDGLAMAILNPEEST